MKDVTAHFERRTSMELKIIEQILGSHAEILQAKAFDIEEVLQKVEA